MYYRFVFVTRNAYEAERINRMADTLSILTHAQDYYAYEVIMRFFDTQYHFAFLAFIGSIIFLVWIKRGIVALYLSISFIAVLAVIFVMHSYLSSNIFIMLDGYLAYLGLVWAIPLAFVIGKENRVWTVLLLSCLMLFSLDRIRQKHTFFSNRLDYMETLIADHTNEEHPKAIFEMENFDFDTLWLGWVMSLETLMISSLEDPDNSRTIFLSKNKGKWDDRLDEGSLFLSVSFGPEFIKHNELPLNFFHLSEVPYKKILLE